MKSIISCLSVFLDYHWNIVLSLVSLLPHSALKKNSFWFCSEIVFFFSWEDDFCSDLDTFWSFCPVFTLKKLDEEPVAAVTYVSSSVYPQHPSWGGDWCALKGVAKGASKKTWTHFSLKAAASAAHRRLKQSGFYLSLGNSVERPDSSIMLAKSCCVRACLWQDQTHSPSSKTHLAQSLILNFPPRCILRVFLQVAWLKLQWRLTRLSPERPMKPWWIPSNSHQASRI